MSANDLHETLDSPGDVPSSGDFDVAVIGMSGRFPGADDLETFWANVREGRECITFFTPEQLRASGHPAEMLSDPSFVPATGRLGDVEHFDAAFFGYSPREAETTEPGHRIFLECAWEALEDAGVDPSRAGGAVAVYAGAAGHGYTEGHVLANPDVVAATGGMQVKLGSLPDFLATRVAYKLDLRGPAVSVQTGCSTSLVAVHLAVQSLLRGECDLALAGGTCVNVPVDTGYMYAPGSIASPDGHCRPFDAASAGAVGGNGCGVVVLKRLADALRDGDVVRAVIRGSAVNNDGAAKVAFSAPGIDGQAAAIGEALALAGVDPGTVGYVETHGTATELGDPIEVAALTRAYRASTRRTGYCALGAVKASVGHLDAAAGIAGFIKTVLVLERGEIPPVVHFTAPNPRIDLASSPFFVPSAARKWETDGHPRRAGVSSFGIGGTNAHVVMEEAPPVAPSGPSRPWQLLALSARSGMAVDAAAARLANHLQHHPDLPLADVAFTLREGRHEFAHRRIAVVREGEDAAAILRGAIPERVASGISDANTPSVVFLFPGLGDHYPEMGRGLYEAEPVFRAEVDRCADVLRPMLGVDLREVLYPGPAPSDEALPARGFDVRRMLQGDAPDANAGRLNRTELAQPAVFVIGYALAKLWTSWGIRPDAVIGHSLGELTAACIAGVLPLEDALTLVAGRARLIQALPGGAMLAVSAGEDALRPHLPPGVAIATVNAPGLCVASGPDAAVAQLERRLGDAGIVARRLATTHAFHSPMMAPAADEVMRLAASVRLRPPQIPVVGNVTGTWLTDQEATDPAYWTRHLLATVRFAEGIGELLREPGRVLLEVGPGQTLSTFARQRAAADGECAPAAVIPSLRYAYDRRPDQAVLLEALGRLWIAGVTPDWPAFRADERRRRVRLPTYSWEKQRYWVDPPADDELPTAVREGKRPAPADWTYVPTWTRTPAPEPLAGTGPILLAIGGEVHIGYAEANGSRADAAAEARSSGADVRSNPADAAASTPPGTGGVASLSEPGRARPVGDAASPIAPDDPSLSDALQTASSVDGQRSSAPAGDMLAHTLRTALSGDGRPVILARCGDAFARTADGFVLRPRSRDDVRALAEAVKDAPPSLVVHATNDPIAFVLLAGALAHTGVQSRVVAVTRGAQEVSGDEEMDPRAAAVLGATRVVQQEHPELRCRAVDVAGEVDPHRLAAEVLADADEPVVALRGRHRWARGFRAVRPERAAAAVREGGVYVFVGGLEGRGAALVQAIAETPGVRIAVIDPRIPAVSELDFFTRMLAADNPVLASAAQVKSLAAAGVEVMTDRADPQQALADGFRRVEERWGRIDGIVHELGMGDLSTLAAVAEANPAAWALELDRVEARLAVLETALAGRTPEWVLLESSLSGVLGSVGLVRTAMANALVDAWAQRAVRAGLPVASVAWDRWTASSADGELGIAPPEVAPALGRVLALAREPNVLVSTGDLESRVRRSGEPVVAPAAPAQRYARPEDLGTTYAPPETDTEARIAEVWQELLGVDHVGVHDDFFALGGHSLLATQIISRLKEMYELELPLKVIFEAPTISKMALLVEEAILAEIDELTEEEAIALAGD